VRNAEGLQKVKGDRKVVKRKNEKRKLILLVKSCMTAAFQNPSLNGS